MIQKMHTVTLHDAETQLAQLVEQAAHGEAFIISKSGRPMVKVIPFDTSFENTTRLGFMAGEISVPEDFDRMGSSEIASLFTHILLWAAGQPDRLSEKCRDLLLNPSNNLIFAQQVYGKSASNSSWDVLISMLIPPF